MIKQTSEIKKYLADFNLSAGYGTTDADLLELLTEEEQVYEEITGSHRWWNDTFCVTKVGDRFVGYSWAMTTGDNNPRAVGWEFDWDSLCWAEKKVIQKVIYVPKGLEDGE